MNKNTNTAMRLCALLLVGLMVLSGCASQQRKQKKPADNKPMVKTEAPVEPMVDSTRNHRTLFVPTGERATSAVMIEKHGPLEVNLGATAPRSSTTSAPASSPMWSSRL